MAAKQLYKVLRLKDGKMESVIVGFPYPDYADYVTLEYREGEVTRAPHDSAGIFCTDSPSGEDFMDSFSIPALREARGYAQRYTREHRGWSAFIGLGYQLVVHRVEVVEEACDCIMAIRVMERVWPGADAAGSR